MEIKKLVIGSKNSKDQKSTIYNIKRLYESREKVVELFDDYSRIISEAKYKAKQGQELNILSPEQILQRLPIALAHLKTY